MFLATVFLLVGTCWLVKAVALHEVDRIEEYHKRNYTWPPKYIPDSAGYKALMESRIAQVAEIENYGDRYEGYMQTVRSAFLVPNFTEHGFGLARCPQDLLDALQQGIHDDFDKKRFETKPLVMEGPRAWFISRPDLTRRALRELEHYAEEWAKGMDLVPHVAYGFRLYRNESVLHMHVDKSQTHIISFILHIDSSEDSGTYQTITCVMHKPCTHTSTLFVSCVFS